MQYACHASDAFNTRFHALLERFTRETQEVLGDALAALILGGGYGRGEGGTIVVDGTEQPYNDLDFVLVVRRKAGLPMHDLDALRKRYEAELKIHVDFSRPLTIDNIRRWPHWLMWQDLLNGHVVLAGPENILLENAPAGLKNPLPPIEAARLLLNRGLGVLWGMRVTRGMEPPPDDDFVRRNYHKCALALGDALLIAHGAYATPYRGRDQRVAALARQSKELEAFALDRFYPAALEYKFTPDKFPGTPSLEEQQAMAERWGPIFLHVETLRTGRPWASLREYAGWPGLREPEEHTPKKLLRNIVRNAQMGKCAWRCPREQFYRLLPQLFGLTGAPLKNWERDTARFIFVWNRFN